MKTYNAAVSAIPGVLFVGGNDGTLNALATADGRKLWSFDTARQFSTVNKVTAGQCPARLFGQMNAHDCRYDINRRERRSR